VPDLLSQYLLLFLWLDDPAPSCELVSWLLAEFSKIYVRHGWRPQMPGEMRRLLAVALDERMHMRPCRECRAEGWVFDPKEARRRYAVAVHNHVPYFACDGRGAFPWSQRRRAKAFGCPWTTWRRRYRARYEALFERLLELERRAIGRLKRHLAEALDDAGNDGA